MEKLDCRRCSERQQKVYGCEGDAEQPLWITTAGRKEKLSRCPRRLVKDDETGFAEIMRLYSLYSKGVLLEDGGVHNQPNRYLSYMSIIEAALSEVQDAKIKEIEKRQAHQANQR